ncbi:MAG: hypothetical protein LBR41_00280 [Rickettsiales bacterium]|jgi:hypothetical protein|nr:hypothetical protein [Rickettsiales bacterium]
MSGENINLSKTMGVPTLSFGGAVGGGLTSTRYDADGFLFDAYYDAAHRLIFVIDRGLSDWFPNTLLVMRDHDGRNWADVLENDFGVDLETVRPKKNNKYLPLDIEYDGLGEYNAVLNGDAGAAARLDAFRHDAAYKNALERLELSELDAERAHATIDTTQKSIVASRIKISELKHRLETQRGEVGREPTKKSAAKILRTESQIDAETAKIKRAELRIRRAKKRLQQADKNAKIIRKIMERGNMADENSIRPLLNSDPNIVDNSAAFNPVDFDNRPGIITPPTPAPTAHVPTPAEYPAPLGAGGAPAPGGGIEISRPLSTSNPVPPAPRNPAPRNDGRPGTLYYTLLLVLIGLSVATLWLYQQKMTDGDPNITAPVAAVESPAPVATGGDYEPSELPDYSAPASVAFDETNPFFDIPPINSPLAGESQSANKSDLSAEALAKVDAVRGQLPESQAATLETHGTIYSDGSEIVEEIYTETTPDGYTATIDDTYYIPAAQAADEPAPAPDYNDHFIEYSEPGYVPVTTLPAQITPDEFPSAGGMAAQAAGEGPDAPVRIHLTAPPRETEPATEPIAYEPQLPPDTEYYEPENYID